MKIIIFDLFDTLLDKVWFDYNKGLEYLADKYFDQRLDKLTLYAEEYRKQFLLDRNETQREKSFFDQLVFYENKFGKKLAKSRDEIEWEVFLYAGKNVLQSVQNLCLAIFSTGDIRWQCSATAFFRQRRLKNIWLNLK